MRYRNQVEREREAASRRAYQRESAVFDRVLRAEAVIKRYVEAHTGERHKVTYDSHTGWYTLTANGKTTHVHEKDLTEATDLAYARQHEQELGGNAD